MQIGIEVEFWVVDRDGRLVDGQDIADAHDRIDPEFVGPLLEVHTEPHRDERELRRDLREVTSTAVEAAAADGRRLVPLGTPLSEAAAPARTDRGELFERIYGEGVRSAKNCAGTHVHVEADDRCRQLNLLTALDPALALLSSSPYYCGYQIASAARPLAYRFEPGERFAPYCDLWTYASTVEEWRRRVDERYEEFLDIGVDCGVDRSTVERRFDPEDTPLAPVRLRPETDTVEWRAPDAALPSQVVRLATDVGKLVRRTADTPVVVGGEEPGVYPDRIVVPEFERLRALTDEAIRWGLDSRPVREYLASFSLDPADYDPISAELRGPGRLHDDEARAIRLTYADRLETDLHASRRDRDVQRTERLGYRYA